MRRNCVVVIALLLAQMTWAATVTKPADIPAYYANANGKSGTSLYNALNTITNKGYHDLGYDGAIDAYQKSDVYPTDPNHPDYVPGRAGQLWDMYGACSFTSGDECGNYNSECDCYNREHSVPKSWWGGGKNDMYSDIFHLVPTDGYVNNRRSNYAFGEVQSATYTYNACKLGSSKPTITTDRETLLGTSATCSGTVFEPRDEYKGDFARGYLGMIAKYSNTSFSITTGAGGTIFEAFSSTTHFGLTKYGIVLLMKWHREDPVSRKEIDRNNGIQATQGNRNPFIDYPYLAEYIWGEKNGQTVDMSKLMPSTDPDFIPGVSNGWRGEDTPPTPPGPVIKHGVTWVVCGVETQVDSIIENSMISTLPDEPASCSEESPVFMGWTNAPIDGYLDDEPAILYRHAEQMPVVTEDVSYYAVFAKEIIIEGTTVPTEVAIDFNAQGYANAKVISAPIVQDDVTVTFAGGSTSPTYYTSGTAVRVYAGGTMTVEANDIAEITLTFGSGDKSNAITTNVGTFASPTWTGLANQVIFTVGGSNGHRKIASVNVTKNGSGSSVSYDRYITDFQSPTEISNLQCPMSNVKLLINNQLYILVGDQLFNLQGQRVK